MCTMTPLKGSKLEEPDGEGQPAGAKEYLQVYSVSCQTQIFNIPDFIQVKHEVLF